MLIGVWDYQDLNLRSIPAAEHSLRRMHELLTGPLCGWPADRVTIIENRQSLGNLPYELAKLFTDVDDDGVALFYFVGHGLTDNKSLLCLALGESVTESADRSWTSLRFDLVREALVQTRHGTRIVILDCCYSGLAVKTPGTLSPPDLLDQVSVTGAYTMCASDAYGLAWYETDVADRPMTYFTKYLADVVESGVAGQAAYLTLDQVFARTRDALDRDNKPVPTRTARHDAGSFPFARNRTPAEPARDLEAEIAEFRAEKARREQEAEQDQRRYRQPLNDASSSSDDLETAARKAGESVQAIASTAVERWGLADPRGASLDVLLTAAARLRTRPDTVLSRLRFLLSHPDRLETIAREAYWHRNGFARVKIVERHGVYVRLHVWPAGENRVGDIDPHGYRWDFASCVAAGQGITETYFTKTDEADSEGSRYVRFEYGRETGSGYLSQQGPAWLRRSGWRWRAVGEVYGCLLGVLHTVAPQGDDLVATVMMQGPVIARAAEVFRADDQPSESFSAPERPITAAELRHLFGAVEAAIGATERR